MKFSKQIVLSAFTAMTVFVLVACGNSGPNQSKQSSQSQASSSVSQSSETVSSNSKANSSANSSSSESATSSQTAVGDLDGVYKATHEGDPLTLEHDDEQEIKQVQIDRTNQTMIVGDDVKRYRVEDNQLTLEDLSQENDDDDTIVFTKE